MACASAWEQVPGVLQNESSRFHTGPSVFTNNQPLGLQGRSGFSNTAGYDSMPPHGLSQRSNSVAFMADSTTPVIYPHQHVACSGRGAPEMSFWGVDMVPGLQRTHSLPAFQVRT